MGIEPAHRGFADPCLTTWLPYQCCQCSTERTENQAFYRRTKSLIYATMILPFMNWKAVGYKGAWYALRGLMYAKRALTITGRFGLRALAPLRQWYRSVVGFRLYKLSFYLKKRAALVGFVRKYTPGHFFAQRYILQLFALALFLFICWPQTKFYRQPLGYSEIPGRQTLLYALVGPGEQDFATDLTTNDEVLVDVSTPDQSWNEGSVSAELNGAARSYVYEDTNQPNTANFALVKPFRTGLIQNSPIPPTQRPREIFVYTVKPGDVLGSIAVRFGISVNTILTANGLTIRSIIKPGNNLKILPVDGVTHVVKKGDTLSKIALAYSAKTADITQFNNLGESGSGLTIGKEIIVPYGRAIVTATKPRLPTKPPSGAGVTEKPISGPLPGSSLASANASGFIWPSGATIVTQYYGWQHTGMDIAGKTGLPNYAAKSGTVVKSQCGWNGGYGCYIILDHGNGVQTLYGHNTQLLVSPGEYVTQGQVIGLLGNTGRSTGPHLHFEVRINGKRVNPLTYIRR